ncbi:DUF6412 domain-containing protein [Halostreptopolyspora alba]|uniref:Uncharacterized protein n=1 Tax=Halostreptopolyspora alba TaxID=2487137 RepID=A0A3N0E963_9ACTN|nr:hypothetical protein EFW17_12640 [Nocardiopsaceae bacterium YIM 96095]
MAAIYAVLHALLLGTFDLSWLSTPPTAGTFAVLAVVAISAALTWMVVRGRWTWPVLGNGPPHGVAMRHRSACTATAAVRDPDAPGKPRPRAPGMTLAAA